MKDLSFSLSHSLPLLMRTHSLPLSLSFSISLKKYSHVPLLFLVNTQLWHSHQFVKIGFTLYSSLPLCLSVSLTVCLSVCLPLCERRSVLLFNVSLSVCHSVLVNPSVCLSFCLSLPATSVCIFVILCLCLSVFLSFCVCSCHDCLSVPIV